MTQPLAYQTGGIIVHRDKRFIECPRFLYRLSKSNLENLAVFMWGNESDILLESGINAVAYALCGV